MPTLLATSPHGTAMSSKRGGTQLYPTVAETWELRLVRNCHHLKPASIAAEGENCPIKRAFPEQV